MNRDDFETLLGSVAAQYEEAYTREIEALRHENRAEYDVLASRVSLLTAAYDAGEIGGRNVQLTRSPTSWVSANSLVADMWQVAQVGAAE